MAPIITGGVSVNEPSLSGHLLSLFQFPLGEDGEGGAGSASIFSCFAVINYGMMKFRPCLLPAGGTVGFYEHSEAFSEPPSAEVNVCLMPRCRRAPK